ncbi:MAG: hypothetical protein K6F64_07755 [Clostridia bacterium]|nr:hypothetical protein [Clostridia bacterium]
MSKFDFLIETKEDLIKAVNDFGFVPLFSNLIRGFSVEEHVSPSAWFSAEEGVWEWKGPVIRETGCAYGKFFEKKAVFVSREWFPDFANYRRDGYDFDARFDDGLASFRDKTLYELVAETAPSLSKRIKSKGGYGKNGRKGFDTVMTRLQAECYVIISDFIYELDKTGKTYGWGVAEYSTPEIFMGESFTGKVYSKEPEESYNLILSHLKSILPDTEENKIIKMLKI